MKWPLRVPTKGRLTRSLDAAVNPRVIIQKRKRKYESSIHTRSARIYGETNPPYLMLFGSDDDDGDGVHRDLHDKAGFSMRRGRVGSWGGEWV